MENKLRRWKLRIEDENGDSHYVQDPVTRDDLLFEGTKEDAALVCESLVDVWESKTGGLCLRVKMESQGKL